MSTALHEPPHGIRVGRLVKAAIKARVLKTPAPAAQPLAPKPQEVRVLLFLSFGGARVLRRVRWSS